MARRWRGASQRVDMPWRCWLETSIRSRTLPTRLMVLFLTLATWGTRRPLPRYLRQSGQTWGLSSALLFNAGSVLSSPSKRSRRQSSLRLHGGSMLMAHCSWFFFFLVPGMKARRSGSILFTGATASLRGSKRTAAFAPAKAAQRSLAESCAYLVAGRHTCGAHAIVDEVSGSPRNEEGHGR